MSVIQEQRDGLGQTPIAHRQGRATSGKKAMLRELPYDDTLQGKTAFRGNIMAVFARLHTRLQTKNLRRRVPTSSKRGGRCLEGGSSSGTSTSARRRQGRERWFPVGVVAMHQQEGDE
eukprot:4832348-Pyramimonas_sp.AAC.1